MTNSTIDFHDIHEYDNTQSIQIIDGSTLLITTVDNLGALFKYIFISPELSTA